MTIASLTIWLILALAVVAIAYIAVRSFGLPIPQWVWHIVSIIIVAVVAIAAIKFLMGVA